MWLDLMFYLYQQTQETSPGEGAQGKHLGRWGRGERERDYLSVLLNFECDDHVMWSTISQLN